ncbi:MAG: hypothetical protein E7399_08285 [Ruminococcaceae bacterium]|nr:hypothetical protein [Oscillospiraceae bacterium]
MTFLERFTEVKERIEKKNTQKCEERFAIQVTMTDEECQGVFYIANTEKGFSVEPYDYKDFTAHIIADSKVLLGILDGTTDPVKEYLSGNVQAEGNLEHVKLLASLKDKPKRKTATKKTTEKKTETKSKGTKKLKE